MTTYTTVDEYIEHNITPGLGDVELTRDQALEIAHRMTERTATGELVERDDIDLWDVVAEVLGDN